MIKSHLLFSMREILFSLRCGPTNRSILEVLPVLSNRVGHCRPPEDVRTRQTAQIYKHLKSAVSQVRAYPENNRERHPESTPHSQNPSK